MISRHTKIHPIGYHFTFRLEDWRVIARVSAERRKLSASIRRVGEGVGVFLHRAADNHVHVAAHDDGTSPIEAARRLAIGMRRALRLPTPVVTKVKPIDDQRHLYNLPGYFFSQEAHHGTVLDPFHDASCLPDLVGARVGASWMRSRLLAVAPRIDIRELSSHLPTLAALDAVRERGLELLADAAAAAVCRHRLTGRDRVAVAARTAAIHVASELGLGSLNDSADVLGISRSTAWRRLGEISDLSLRVAIRLQLGMRVGRGDAMQSACAPGRDAVQPIGAPGPDAVQLIGVPRREAG